MKKCHLSKINFIPKFSKKIPLVRFKAKTFKVKKKTETKDDLKIFSIFIYLIG